MSVLNPFEVDMAGEAVCQCWHPKYPILAVANSLGSVVLFNEEGVALDPAKMAFQRDAMPTCMGWSPKQRTLVVGWEDGIVSLWNDKDRRLLQNDAMGQSPISLVQWSPEGSRVVVGNGEGVIAVWSGDSRLFDVRHLYQMEGRITRCAFATNSILHPLPEGDVHPCPAFFVGNQAGVCYLADDSGNCEPACKIEASPGVFLWDEARATLVVLTLSSDLVQQQLTEDKQLMQTMRLKIGGGSLDSGRRVCDGSWAGPSLLATVSGEPFVRLLNLETDDYYTLTQPSGALASEGGSILQQGSCKFTSVCFNSRKRTLVAGTEDGRIFMWQFVSAGGPSVEDTDWEFVRSAQLHGCVLSMEWGPREDLFRISMDSMLVIMMEETLKRAVRDSIAAVQTGPSSVAIMDLDMGSPTALMFVEGNIRIKGLDISESHLVLWSGRNVEVFEISVGKRTSKQVAMFEVTSMNMRLFRQNLFVLREDCVEMLGLQGQSVRQLPFSERQGEPVLITLFGDVMAVCTNQNFVKLFSLRGREPAQVSPGAQVLAAEEGVVTAIRCNKNAKKVAFLISYFVPGSDVQYPDNSVYVFDIDHHEVISYDFSSSKRFPVSLHWDSVDEKLLVVETKYSRSTEGNTELESSFRASKSTVPLRGESLYVTSPSEYGMVLSDSFALEKGASSVLAVRTPSMYFLAPVNLAEAEGSSSGSLVKKVTMRDFQGIELNDPETRDSLGSFAFYLTVGNMDEAYRAVKKIKDKRVWQNMAEMCVKTKRMDVAEICMGQLENAKGAMAVRRARAEPEKEAQVAALALELGMYEEAEALYEECGRFDLLNRLYQSLGMWDRAIDVAETRDRIHLKNTYHVYGVHLLESGRTEDAIAEFEKAGTARRQVPSILLSQGNTVALEQYIDRSKDKALYKWWAQFSESTNNLEEAKKYYKLASETCEVCRILCMQGNPGKAEELANETDSGAAFFTIGEFCEEHGQVREAVSFFARAGSLRKAIRLAMSSGESREVLNLSLAASADIQLEAANYFEDQRMFDKAILLHQKAGNLQRAIDLSFQTNQFQSLQGLAADISSSTNPETISRCAQFFLENSQFEKATTMYIKSGELERALSLAEEHSVSLTEEMCNDLTLPKTRDQEQTKRRQDLLLRMARLLEKQGDYQQATKKYTQGGDNVAAMKALIRSGDVEKIVFYAGVLKNRETYILAANYLQSMDWHEDPEIMQNIINFYTRARAFDYLANFYAACADIEIDEFQEYDRALEALREAVKYMEKSHIEDRAAKVVELQGRTRIMERFLEARQLANVNDEKMMSMFRELLEESDLDASVRVGDVFAEMIGFHYSKEQFVECNSLLEKMRDRGVQIKFYIDEQVVKLIEREAGVSRNPSSSARVGFEVEDEEIAEDIAGM